MKVKIAALSLLVVALSINANAYNTPSANYIRVDAISLKSKKLKFATGSSSFNKIGSSKKEINSFGAGYGIKISNIRTDINFSNFQSDNNNFTGSDPVFTLSGFSNLPTNVSFKVKHMLFLASAHYDFGPMFQYIYPYVTVGAGMDKMSATNLKYSVQVEDTSTNLISKSISKNGLVYQFGGGVTLKMTENLDIDVSYDVIKVGNMKKTLSANIGTVSNPQVVSQTLKFDNLDIHRMMAGIRFNF